MQALNFPSYTFRITRDEEGKMHIFDTIRKKQILLTPEEWVRQHVLKFLTSDREFPASLISTEAGIKVNRQSRRYDALVYDRKGDPLMLIECKAPSVRIGQAVFDQIIAYNRSLKAPYLFVSNGLKHFCCRYDTRTKEYVFLKGIPLFGDMFSELS